MGQSNKKVKAFPYDENNRPGSALFVPIVDSNGAVIDYAPHQEERKITQNFTTVSTGTAVTFDKSKSNFTLGGVLNGDATTFDVRLEGSIDGTNYTELGQATESAPGAGKITFIANKPVTSVRLRMAAITPGSGSVDVNLLAKE